MAEAGLHPQSLATRSFLVFDSWGPWDPVTVGTDMVPAVQVPFPEGVFS